MSVLFEDGGEGTVWSIDTRHHRVVSEMQSGDRALSSGEVRGSCRRARQG